MSVVDIFRNYFQEYGLLLLFIIVFLEYLNLPGFPAGIIMPLAGMMCASSNLSLIAAVLTSILGGLLGSIVLYLIGLYLGDPVLNWLSNRYPKINKPIDKAVNYCDKYGDKGVFISRLIPVARTLCSLIAGTFKINIFKFSIYSVFGIAIWNFVFIFAGYFFGDVFFKF